MAARCASEASEHLWADLNHRDTRDVSASILVNDVSGLFLYRWSLLSGFYGLEADDVWDMDLGICGAQPCCELIYGVWPAIDQKNVTLSACECVCVCVGSFL